MSVNPKNAGVIVIGNEILSGRTQDLNVAYIGEKLDWKLLPYPVDFYLPKKFNIKPTLNLLGNFNYTQKGSHEWIGLISYYLMGRSEKIF